MKRFVLTMFVLLMALPAVAAAKIYSWTNAQGVVVYSDRKPPPGVSVHKVDLPPLITVPVPKQQKVPTTPRAAARQSPGMQAEHLKIQILSPQDKQAIRANNGHVTVLLAIRPALAQGQTIRLYVDGQSAYAGHSLTIGLRNLDRGAHHAYAQVVSPGGDVLARSDTVTFYVLRHSILFKKPIVPAS